MWNRASGWNLVLSLVAYVFFMYVLLVALGFGVGIPELPLWLGVLGVGIVLIVRRHNSARADLRDPRRG